MEGKSWRRRNRRKRKRRRKKRKKRKRRQEAHRETATKHIQVSTMAGTDAKGHAHKGTIRLNYTCNQHNPHLTPLPITPSPPPPTGVPFSLYKPFDTPPAPPHFASHSRSHQPASLQHRYRRTQYYHAIALPSSRSIQQLPPISVWKATGSGNQMLASLVL